VDWDRKIKTGGIKVVRRIVDISKRNIRMN
jgi:hypothetical protein